MEKFAIPETVTTTFENDEFATQLARMRNVKDAALYASSCRRYGATIDNIIHGDFGTFIVVTYKKDSEGKIGIPS